MRRRGEEETLKQAKAKPAGLWNVCQIALRGYLISLEVKRKTEISS